MVVHATSPKPFPSPLARVVVAPLQMRNFNVKTPSSLWTFHHAVPSPSFSTWELSVTENQCQSVYMCILANIKCHCRTAHTVASSFAGHGNRKDRKDRGKHLVQQAKS